MVSITELMQYGSRRKIEAIAKKLGYDKADEYPDELLDIVKSELGVDPSISEKAQHAAHKEAQTEAEADLQAVQIAAEHRAAGLLVSLDSLTMMHCATRQFSEPSLQASVDESHQRIKDMLTGFADYYRPERFLAQTPLTHLTREGNGLTSSPSSQKVLPTKSAAPNSKPAVESSPASS